MKEVRFFYTPEPEAGQLPTDEAQHALRVLRLQMGDEIHLMDGTGGFYRAVITEATGHHCRYRIEAREPQQPEWTGMIHLAVAPTKNMDRMEWLAEKATEVGIDELSFLNCQFSERHVLKTERIRKIVVAAVKQSHKAFMPVIGEMTSFRQFISDHDSGHRYIAHCYQEVERVNLFDQLCALQPCDDALVMIGPEGDFSIDEVRMAVDAGFVSVDLGKSRLRTETAGLSAVMMMQLALLYEEVTQMKKLILSCIVALAAVTSSATDTYSLRVLFKQMPDSVIPYLSTNNRLDFLDFMDSQMKAEVTNNFGGKSQMTLLTDTLITIRLNEACTVDLLLLRESR